jgi:hypothetical protein
VSKRPSEMTDAERDALPIGPDAYIDRPATPEEMARTGARLVREYQFRELKIEPVRRDDLAFWIDANREVWSFGQWADGQWYKSPF